MGDEKIRITILLSKGVVEKIDEDRIGKFVFLGKRSPMIEQILRKHYKFESVFDMENNNED